MSAMFEIFECLTRFRSFDFSNLIIVQEALQLLVLPTFPSFNFPTSLVYTVPARWLEYNRRKGTSNLHRERTSRTTAIRDDTTSMYEIGRRTPLS